MIPTRISFAAGAADEIEVVIEITATSAASGSKSFQLRSLNFIYLCSFPSYKSQSMERTRPQNPQCSQSILLSSRSCFLSLDNAGFAHRTIPPTQRGSRDPVPNPHQPTW